MSHADKFAKDFAKSSQSFLPPVLGGLVTETIYLAVPAWFGEPSVVGSAVFLVLGAVLGRLAETTYYRHVVAPKELVRSLQRTREALEAAAQFEVTIMGDPWLATYEDLVVCALQGRVTATGRSGTAMYFQGYAENESGERRNMPGVTEWNTLGFGTGRLLVSDQVFPKTVDIDEGKTVVMHWVGYLPKDYWERSHELYLRFQCMNFRNEPFFSRPVQIPIAEGPLPTLAIG